MSVFDIETEASRRSREAVERDREAREQRESDEGESVEDLKAAAALERADFLVREIKSSQTQMQNIILHMQSVMAAIKALREQLRLALVKGERKDEASVAVDKRRVAELKKRVASYSSELLKMKDDLIREQMEVLRAGASVNASADVLTGAKSGAGAKGEADVSALSNASVRTSASRELLRQKAETMVAEILRVVELG